jgi:amidase
MTNLTFATASQLAQMIRDRETSAVEVLEAYLAQIAKYNPTLNAICTLDAENARIRAKQADAALAAGENWGALHGVPVTIKDIFATAGLRTTAGYVPLRDYIPDRDATAVGRLRSAGAIILGKTNVAELAGDFQSTNSIFPRVNNPWDLTRTPGGSSGGSVAAIAAGLSPLDIGNDFGGSIRQPAHFCGIYALKPTDRRISTLGMIPETPGMPYCLRQMMTVGCFGRSIADLRLSLTIIVGADLDRPDVPPVPLDLPSGKSLKDLKIAWIDEWDEVPVDVEIQAAIQQAVGELDRSGARVERWLSSDFDLGNILQIYERMAAYINNYTQPKDRYIFGRSLTLLWRCATQGDAKLRRLSNFSRALPEMLNPTTKGYFETLTARDLITTQLDRALADWDVWLMPVAATTAFTHRPAWSAIDVNGRSYPHSVANGAYVIPFNLSGHPAVVIPIGQTANGLPIGMQIVGKRWQEMELLAIAQEIDRVVGKFQQPPL